MSLALACLALLGLSPLVSTPAAAETCVNVMQNIKQGQSYHGALCNSVDGCKCTAKKCRVTLTLPGTSHKEEKTQYKHAKCENTVKLNSNVPSSCRPFEGSINNGQTFSGVKCKESGGCFCSGMKCGNKVMNVKCWKAPT